MFEYRGRKLTIKQKYLDDYERFHGIPFSQVAADEYIYNKYIWDKTKENEVPQVVESLSNQELIELIENALCFINGFYFLDPNYGQDIWKVLMTHD